MIRQRYFADDSAGVSDVNPYPRRNPDDQKARGDSGLRWYGPAGNAMYAASNR